MKLHHDPSNIERVGVESENSFTIKSTAKSFEILSSALYTDPIAAIIRELSCNAYDSHVAAGKSTTPFQIHLPNRLEPFLSIKDFGIGLSDEDVLHLYTTYFDSTKTDSNDFIGALGLGSKSPFSYSTSYEVISIFDGFLRSYHMFIDENGIPDVVKMTTQMSTETNGLEVKIGIEPKDFNIVIQKTASTLKHFKVPPTIVGALHFEFDKLPLPIKEGPMWKIISKPYNHNHRIIAIQGNVQYKVNVSQFDNDLTDGEKTLLNNVCLIGYFNIGDIEVAANREEIRYDTHSKQNVISLIRKCAESLAKDVITICDKATNKWDLYITLADFSNNIFNTGYCINDIVNRAKVNNPIFDAFLDSSGCVTYPTQLQYHTIHTYSNHGSLVNNYTRTVTSSRIEPTQNAQVVLNDVTVGGVVRMTSYLCKSDTTDKFIVIKRIKKREFSKTFFLNYPNFTEPKNADEEYNNIINLLGQPTVQLVSELCPSVSQQQKRKRTLKAFTYGGIDYNRRYNNIVRWDDHICDVESGGLYFVLKHNVDIIADYDNTQTLVNWKDSKTKTKIQNLVQLINIGEGHEKYRYQDLVGISVATYNKVKKNPKWVDAFKLAEVALKKVKRHIIAQQKIQKTKDVLGIVDVLQYQTVRDTIQHKLKPSSPFRKLVFPIIKKINAMEGNQQLYNFCSNLQRNVYSKRNSVDETQYFEESDFSRYPLLKQLERIPTDDKLLDNVIEYITLIDEKKK